MDCDDDDELEPDEDMQAIAEQLHLAFQSGYAAGVAAEKERRNAQARRSRRLRKIRNERLT